MLEQKAILLDLNDWTDWLTDLQIKFCDSLSLSLSGGVCVCACVHFFCCFFFLTEIFLLNCFFFLTEIFLLKD